MKLFLRRLLILFGYLIYTGCVVVVLLWVLFPADSALTWLQGRLQAAYPTLTLSASDSEKAFPLKLRVADILVRDRREEETPLVRIDEIQVSPALEKMIGLKNQLPLRYRLQTLDGTVTGELRVPFKGPAVQCTGEIRDIELAGLEQAWEKVNRTGSGTLSGTFQYSGPWQDPLQGKLQAALHISDGTIGLLQPIFGLEQIDFHSMSTTLTQAGNSVALADGVLDSRLFNAGFKGNVRLSDSFYTSSINIQGFMKPRPELLGGLQNATAASLIKSQLQDDKLSFTLSGTLVEPGIQFKGASGVIDGVIEGGAR